jgi:AcrR family transcriptional regulator
MRKQSTAAGKISARSDQRRRYDNKLRQAQSDETRARILAAGSQLAHRAKGWDWKELTVRAIAEQAGVSDRTVYRHFATERQLHEALGRHLEAEAGVYYEGAQLNELGAITERVFTSLPSYAASPIFSIREASFGSGDERRRAALLQAVEKFTSSWAEQERRMAAAMLDVLWSPTSYERLVTRWGFDTATATRAVTQTIDVLTQAVRSGKRPWRDGERSAGTRQRTKPTDAKTAKSKRVKKGAT